MKIGFFSDSYFPEIDGVTYTLKLWKQRLEERGHEVYIIYPKSKEYTPEENEIPVTSIPNPFYSGYNIPVPFSVDLPDFDVVHCHSPAMIGRLGQRYADKNSIPSVYTHHTPLEEYFSQAVKSNLIGKALGKVYVPFEERFLRGFDTVTSNTDEGRRDIELKELPVGLDLKFFQPTDEVPETFSDVDTEKNIAGYSGRISGEKNVDEVLEMAEDFEGEVLIVGEGPLKSEMVEKAGENVEFSDFLDREELPRFYSMLDVFVTASTGDTLGLSTLEANACGTPVVAPDVHPFDRTIRGENGCRYVSGDSEDMRDKAMDAASREWDTRDAVQKYSLEKTIEKVESIYRELEG